METILKNIAVPAGVGRSTESLPGETVILKAVSTDTDGAYTLVEVINEPQSGPPLHLHWHEDVAFYILEGTFTFQIGNRALTATAGWFMTAPKGVPRSYKNIDTTPARMLALFAPAGMENLFEDLLKLTAAGTWDMDNIVAVFAQVPDLRATLVASTIHDDLAWAEWHWQGTRTSGSALNMRGVSVTGLRNGIIAWARLYIEPIHN